MNHLAGYEAPIRADIPHQDVIYLDEADPVSLLPMKTKGVAKLVICAVAAAMGPVWACPVRVKNGNDNALAGCPLAYR